MTGRGALQLVLDLPNRTALGRDDFLVTESNEAAVAMIDRYPDWPSPVMALAGPAGSGKTHLLEVWRQVSGASFASLSDITEESVPGLAAAGALAVDNAPGECLREKALFHLLNHAHQTGTRILIASVWPPASWPVQLPDLLTRLKALPVIQLKDPDDALLRGVLVKLFADRQLSADEGVISYLVSRMPRALGAARALVAEVDRRALADKAEITRPFVAKVLEDLKAPGLFDELG